MTEQLALQMKMRTQFLELKNRNPAYSLRAFAKKLSLSPSAVSEILNGKRRVSRELASQILEQMGADPKEKHNILSLFRKGTPAESQQPTQQYLEITADQFELLSKWYHFAILSLAETKGFVADPLWIAKRLGIQVPEAERALERLERLEFAKWSRSRKSLKVLHGQLTSSDDVANQAIRQSHYEDLDLASKALEKVAVEDRDFTSMTMAIDKSKLPQAKKMIREFQDQLMAFLESGTQTEVYKFCFHFLPLSQPVEK